ncbi:MAG: phage major tail tube protein [Ruminococcus sp.]|nr:phage major tail tube protein [Ruminococcus sp.]
MPRIDESVINYMVYQEGTQFLGMAEVQLPDIDNVIAEVKGAGLNGTIESPVVGHVNAMSIALNFRTLTKEAYDLLEPRNHQIDLRIAQQSTNSATGEAGVSNVKHVLVIRPKKFTPGKVAPATVTDANGDYSVSYWATWVDGKKTLEIDIMNFIYYVNGKDYLAEVRKAIGK